MQAYRHSGGKAQRYYCAGDHVLLGSTFFKTVGTFGWKANLKEVPAIYRKGSEVPGEQEAEFSRLFRY